MGGTIHNEGDLLLDDEDLELDNEHLEVNLTSDDLDTLELGLTCND